MRWLHSAILLTLVACGSEGGAVIVVHGDVVVSRIEVILASAEAEHQQRQIMQRSAPMELVLEPVDYFKQRDTIGSIPIGGRAEGFSFRIEQDSTRTTDASYVPLVFAYGGEPEILVAIGRAGQGAPAEITIPGGEAYRFDVYLEAVSPADPANEIGAQRALTVSCSNQTKPKGHAWRFSSGPQQRLILPNEGNDATIEAGFDLDCDSFEPKDAKIDCDDLRDTFNKDAAEACGSTVDYDCNGAFVGKIDCSFGGANGDACVAYAACTNPTCELPGIDVLNATDRACACALGRCGACQLAHHQNTAMNGERSVCQPSIAQFGHLCPPVPDPATQTCTVSATMMNTNTSFQWEVLVHRVNDPSPPTASVTISPLDNLEIIARPITSPVPDSPPSSNYGELELLVMPSITQRSARYYQLVLEPLVGSGRTECPVSGSSLDGAKMLCSPP